MKNSNIEVPKPQRRKYNPSTALKLDKSSVQVTDSEF